MTQPHYFMVRSEQIPRDHRHNFTVPERFSLLLARAGFCRPKGGFLAIGLLLGLAAAVQGGTNGANSAVMETHSMYVIDARTEAEWKAGHIKDAILIPYDQIKVRIAEVTTNKSASIALYCRSGRRSEIARRSLQELGYVNVENLGSLHDARKKLGVLP